MKFQTRFVLIYKRSLHAWMTSKKLTAEQTSINKTANVIRNLSINTQSKRTVFVRQSTQQKRNITTFYTGHMLHKDVKRHQVTLELDVNPQMVEFRQLWERINQKISPDGRRLWLFSQSHAIVRFSYLDRMMMRTPRRMYAVVSVQLASLCKNFVVLLYRQSHGYRSVPELLSTAIYDSVWQLPANVSTQRTAVEDSKQRRVKLWNEIMLNISWILLSAFFWHRFDQVSRPIGNLLMRPIMNNKIINYKLHTFEYV